MEIDGKLQMVMDLERMEEQHQKLELLLEVALITPTTTREADAQIRDLEWFAHKIIMEEERGLKLAQLEKNQLKGAGMENLRVRVNRPQQPQRGSAIGKR
jgi:hypothetical protein